MDGYDKITHINGLNSFFVNARRVGDNEEVFLRRNGQMVNLETFAELQRRPWDLGFRGFSERYKIIGNDGTNYGVPDELLVNLFVAADDHTGVLSQMVRSRGSHIYPVDAHRIGNYLSGEKFSHEKLDKIMQRDVSGGKSRRKTKRKTRRKGKKSRGRK